MREGLGCNEVKLYYDVILVSTDTDSRILNNDQPIRIGGSDNPMFHFNGNIDDVRIYKRAFNAQEVMNLFETSD